MLSPRSASHTWADRRLAVVHTPMTARGSLSSRELEPVSAAIGTCRAMECTFSSLVAFTPGSGLLKTCMPYLACSCWKGRRVARSKIDPRST